MLKNRSTLRVADRRRRRLVAALYLGGMLGPFGTMVVLPIFPELRETFDASSAAIGWSLSAYLFPMAALLLISGTVGERMGRRRCVRTSYAVYFAGTVMAALAPSLAVFLTGRVIMGASSAFVTPLLVAGLGDIVPPDRMGKALGTYLAFQAAGGVLAPMAGGLAGEVNWRFAFAAVALLAALLWTSPPSGEPRPDAEAPPWRPLLSRRVGLITLASLSAQAGPAGVNYLVSLKIRDVLGQSASRAGLVLVIGSLAVAVASRRGGGLVDRFGPRTVGLSSTVVAGVVALAMGWIGGIWSLTAALAISSVASALLFVGVFSLASNAVEGNRAGALSVGLSGRFGGLALSPLMWVPVFEIDPAYAFVGAASLSVVTLFAFARSPSPVPGESTGQ